MFKSFLMKQMMRKQLAALPERERALLIMAIEKNPDFFMNIAKEVDAKKKEGIPEQLAAMAVMKKHESELRRMLGR